MRARADTLSAQRAVRVLLQLARKQVCRTTCRRRASLNALFRLAAPADIRRLGAQLNRAEHRIQAAYPANQATIAAKRPLLEKDGSQNRHA